jgi:hypothetical protein
MKFNVATLMGWFYLSATITLVLRVMKVDGLIGLDGLIAEVEDRKRVRVNGISF